MARHVSCFSVFSSSSYTGLVRSKPKQTCALIRLTRVSGSHDLKKESFNLFLWTVPRTYRRRSWKQHTTGSPLTGKSARGAEARRGVRARRCSAPLRASSSPRLTPRTLSEYLLPGTKTSESTQISHKYKANSSLTAHKLSSS